MKEPEQERDSRITRIIGHIRLDLTLIVILWLTTVITLTLMTSTVNSEEQLKPKTLEDQLMEASYLLHKQEFSELYLETGEMAFFDNS